MSLNPPADPVEFDAYWERLRQDRLIFGETVQDIVVDLIAQAIVRSAHDIADPRRTRNEVG